MADVNESQTAQQTGDLTKTSDFVERYANNIRFETSVWDLKILFATLDQSSTPPNSRPHTSMNIPWPQAKVALFLMYVNLLFHEKQFGEVVAPFSVQPKPLDEFFQNADDPETKRLLDRARRLHEDLFGQ